MNIGEIREHVEGWLDPNEAQLLHDLAGQVEGYCIVEIGSYRGRSTLCMALGVMDAGKRTAVFAIDPHLPSDNENFGDQDRAALLANIVWAGAGEIVRVIDLPSMLAADALAWTIGLLFIDGGHDYENVHADFASWTPFVQKGGLVALHDSEWPGPKKVIAEALARGGFEFVARADATTVLRKVMG